MRRPLAWLIALEVLVVAALAAATYHVVATRWNGPAAAGAVAAAPLQPARKATPKATSRPPTPTRAPATTPTPAPAPRPTGPPPGLTFDPAFWAGQLQRVNHDQNALEQLQWQVTSAVTGWVRSYVKQVLLPAVQEAEKK
jgi:hypothetical protein